MTQPLTITDSARKRLVHLLEKDGRPNLMFRISVSGGGCSGFQYSFGFSDEVKSNDKVFDFTNIKVVSDEASLELIGGTEIDYVENLIGSHFKLNNPNSAGGCGCGNSFSV